MKDIKMIVTDLDDTLLRSDKTIAVKTIDVLDKCQKQGIVVVIATARFWIGAEKYIDFIKPDYVISADGTMIHDKEKLVDGSSFDVETTNKIIQMIKEADGNAEILTAVDKNVYWNSMHIAESEKLFKAKYFDYSSQLAGRAGKIATILTDEEAAKTISNECDCKIVKYRDESLYSFIPKDAGKLSMIQKLTERLGISLDEVIAFGDDISDMEMLEACGVGVAVANALPQVKEKADEVADSNNENGVALFIEKYLIRK